MSGGRSGYRINDVVNETERAKIARRSIAIDDSPEAQHPAGIQ
jgi:hypothetical protein